MTVHMTDDEYYAAVDSFHRERRPAPLRPQNWRRIAWDHFHGGYLTPAEFRTFSVELSALSAKDRAEMAQMLADETGSVVTVMTDSLDGPPVMLEYNPTLEVTS